MLKVLDYHIGRIVLAILVSLAVVGIPATVPVYAAECVAAAAGNCAG